MESLYNLVAKTNRETTYFLFRMKTFKIVCIRYEAISLETPPHSNKKYGLKIHQ